MLKYTEIRSPKDAAAFQRGNLPLFDMEEIVGHGCDAHWVATDGNETVARCSLWWNHVPPHPDHKLGVIGHYAARDIESARELLHHVCGELAAHGCTMAVGPMDGNTWRRYRFITERGTEPTFFLEPDNPDEYPKHFVESGFAPLANYTSAINNDLSREDPRIPEIEKRLTSMGIRVRNIEPLRFEEELRGIYAVSAISFRQNFLYTPIPENEFAEQYRKVLPYVRPELVFLVEKDSRLIAYGFALPDLAQAKRGVSMDTVIFKTIAVLPEFAGAGIGHAVFARVHRAARELGFKRVIHALMFNDNRSRRLSNHYAQTMRRYTLFARLIR